MALIPCITLQWAFTIICCIFLSLLQGFCPPRVVLKTEGGEGSEWGFLTLLQRSSDNCPSCLASSPIRACVRCLCSQGCISRAPSIKVQHMLSKGVHPPRRCTTPPNGKLTNISRAVVPPGLLLAELCPVGDMVIFKKHFDAYLAGVI